MAELAAYYQLVPAQISHWKLQLGQQAAQVFAEQPAPIVAVSGVEPLYATVFPLSLK